MESDLFQQHSGSSQKALEWADTRARYNNQIIQKSVSSIMICPVDILVGIFLAHPQSSEPDQLINHYKITREKLYEKLRAIGGFTPDEAASYSVESLAEMPPLDSEAQKVIAKSLELSEKYNPEQPRLVRLRDLFGGILLTANEAQHLLEQTLTEYSISFKDLVDSYPNFLAFPSQEKEYQQFLKERLPVIRFTVSGFSADTAKGQEDYIGIGAEVDAFAYLITAKELKPPLAIGLFGDWGSGKSFFMEALQNRIHKITTDAQHSGQPQRDISIYKYIAQIEFNAWHYVEGELWASLVEHIFQNLQTRPEDAPGLLAERQKHWIEKLESARRAQLQVEAEKNALETQLTQANAHVHELEQQRDETLRNLQQLQALDVLEAIELTEPERQQIEQTMQKLGVTQLEQSHAALMQGVQELRTVLARGNALTTPLRERGWKWAVALIVVIFAGPVISLLLASIKEVPILTNILTSISTFLGGLTILLKSGTAWLSRAVSQIEKAQSQLEAKKQAKAAEFTQQLAEAQQQYAAVQQQHEQAQQAAQAIQLQITEIEQQLQHLTPARILFDFITERVGSQDYRKHLGVAALIRRDFNQLSELIQSQNNTFIEQDTGEAWQDDSHIINRIVLYVDDLDRCPPEKVVQVLQAVHLLLAFPLFVVVVAVDARWLSQSLQSYYKNLLSTYHQQEGLELAGGFTRQASPQDYLEKIFQIPFWVRPLPAAARVRVVKRMIAGSMQPTLPEIPDETDTEKPTAQQQTEGAAPKREIPSVQLPEVPRNRSVTNSIITNLTPPSLDIEAVEFEFMENLQSLLGETPRSIKRFVNVYRLLKAVAMNDNETFVSDVSTAPFKLVQFLLAVLTGLPEISRGFFRLLQERQSETTAIEIVNQPAPTKDRATLGEIIVDLRQILASGGIVPVQRNNDLAGTQEIKPVTQSHEFMDALDDLNRLEAWIKHEGWMGYDAAVLGGWISEVARFSYRQEQI